MPTNRSIYRGHWWLPAEPTEKQQGTLIIEESGAARLELIGGFRDITQVPLENGQGVGIAPGNGFDMILGRCGNDGFTLLECATLSSKNLVFNDPSDHTLNVSRVLRGGFLEKPNEQCFTRLEVEFDYLLAFTKLSTIEASVPLDEECWGHQRAESTPFAPHHAQWRNLDFQLAIKTSNFRAEYLDQNTRRLGTTERAMISVSSSEAMTLREIDQVIGTLQDLITLAMSYPCGVRSLTLTADSDVGDLHFEVFNAWIYRAEASVVKNLDHNYAFSLLDTSFESIIPSWFKLYERVRTSARMLLGTYYIREGYAGTRLMTICAALESLHRVLYDFTVYSEEEFREIKKQLKSVDKEYRGKVQVYNSPSYAERIRDLTTKADTEAVSALLSDIDRWVSFVRDARVNLAHALAAEGSRDARASERPFRLMRVSRALMVLVLMNEVGLGPECQRRFVSQHNETSWDASRWRILISD